MYISSVSVGRLDSVFYNRLWGKVVLKLWIAEYLIIMDISALGCEVYLRISDKTNDREFFMTYKIWEAINLPVSYQ